MGIELPPEVVSFIAGLYEPHARDIEVAVRHDSASVRFIGCPVTVKFAAEIRQDLAPLERRA